MKEKIGKDSENKEQQYPLLPDIGIRVEKLEEGFGKVVYDDENPIDRDLLNESIKEIEEE